MSQELESLRAQALERMQRDVGIWECRWEFLGDDGKVAGQATGTQSFEFTIPDSVMLIRTIATEVDAHSVGHRYFDPIRKQIVWQTVDRKGDAWTFVESETGESSESLPHQNDDGTVDCLRFHTTQQTDAELQVTMEISKNGGDWKSIFRMVRSRRPNESPDIQ